MGGVFGGVFVQSAIVLLREGLEAMLVVAALGAYLQKSGATQRLPALYFGALAAILASLAAAWVFQQFYGGAHNDLVEGVVILIAAGLMLYVSGWLLLRQDPRAWQAYLRQRADDALARQTGWAVAALSFLAVFREGAETVLFIHALAKTSGGWSMELAAGLGAASVLLVGCYFIIQTLTRSLPLRPVFLATSFFLFVMALKFIGQGLQEFQEQALLPYHQVNIGWLEAIGLNPTAEALGAQIVVVILAALTFLALQRRSRGVAFRTSQAPAE